MAKDVNGVGWMKNMNRMNLEQLEKEQNKLVREWNRILYSGDKEKLEQLDKAIEHFEGRIHEHMFWRIDDLFEFAKKEIETHHSSCKCVGCSTFKFYQELDSKSEKRSK